MALSNDRSDVQRKLTQINREAEERDAKRRADSTGSQYIDLGMAPLEIGALELLEEKEAKAARVAIFEKRHRELAIAAYNPADPETQKVFKKLEAREYKLDIFVVSLRGLNNVWKYYEFIVPKGKGSITGKVEIDQTRLEFLRQKLETLESAHDEIASFLKNSPVTSQIVEILLAAAITLRSSDIHLEPEATRVKFRIRIDGLLHDVFEGLNLEEYFFLISRIKLLSSMKLNVHDIPQDGRFTIGLGGKKEIEIRTSILPSEYGETAVLRILDPETIGLKLESLGVRSDDLVVITKELGRPNGMILNTGPTGSGKTTTLYAFLIHVNKPEVKIITIEDPIEYRLSGIEQTQVNLNSGYNFASGLRSIVRQDPDVVLVGEIRDLETAEVAMSSSLTGHLVFSTLHTNDSFGAIPRLVELGVRPDIIGPSLNLIIAQRLVRRLCDNCKAAYEPDAAVKRKIENFVDRLPQRVDKKPYLKTTLYKAVGCNKCGKIGYRDRVGIFELFIMDDEMKELIHKEVSEVTIKEAVAHQGIVTLQEDGILKVINGSTTFDEVVRISGPLEW